MTCVSDNINNDNEIARMKLEITDNWVKLSHMFNPNTAIIRDEDPIVDGSWKMMGFLTDNNL